METSSVLQVQGLHIEFIEAYKNGHMTLDELLSYGFDKRDYKTYAIDKTKDTAIKSYTCEFNELYVKLLKDDLVEFSDLIQYFIKISEYDQLLKQRRFFNTLKSFNLLTNDAVCDLYANVGTKEELFEACKNLTLLRIVLQVDPNLLKDRIEKVPLDNELSVLCYAISAAGKDILDNLKDFSVLRRLFDKIDSFASLQYFNDAENIVEVLKKHSLLTYNEFVKKYVEYNGINLMFRSSSLSSFLKDFTDEERFNQIKNLYEIIEREELSATSKRAQSAVFYVCMNDYVMNEFFKDFEVIDKFNKLFSQSSRLTQKSFSLDRISSIFDIVNSYASRRLEEAGFEDNQEKLTLNEELLKNSEVLQSILNFDKFNDQEKLSIHTLVMASDRAKNNFLTLAKANLLDTYETSQELLSVLSKDDEKKRVRLNF